MTLDWRDVDALAVVLWTARQATNKGHFSIAFDAAGDKQQQDFRVMAQAAIDFFGRGAKDPPAPGLATPPAPQAEESPFAFGDRDGDEPTLAEAQARTRAAMCSDEDGPDPESLPF